MEERTEIEILREAAMDAFEKSDRGMHLDMQRKIAEEALKSKFPKEEHEFVETCIDNITEFFFEEAVYIFHKAHEK